MQLLQLVPTFIKKLLSSVKQLYLLYQYPSHAKSIASLSWDGESLGVESLENPGRKGYCVIQIHLVPEYGTVSRKNLELHRLS